MRANRIANSVLLLVYGFDVVLSQPSNVQSSLADSSQIAFLQDSSPPLQDNDQSSSIIYPSEPVVSSNPEVFLSQAIQALQVMQNQFFELWIGTWPTAIDWTAAVANTHVSALLGSLAQYPSPDSHPDSSSSSNDKSETNNNNKIHPSELIHRYFSHNIAYYFGEDAFAIRNEAYDDMLWVVLGWLEAINFISTENLSTKNHFNSNSNSKDENESWHGTQWIPAFAHRARIFWDIASKGWDTSLCGGGMNWNPRLTPYKNAVTNQLFISASVGMYLGFPGDGNACPFGVGGGSGLCGSGTASTIAAEEGHGEESAVPPGRAFDKKYLRAAVEGYDWLKGSNMTNSQGLYVDGFHISDWGLNGTNGTGKCDERNEQVYTYNQGVILSGIRGLWEATGNSTYLKDGYELLRNVMAATGWSERRRMDSRWSGLGRMGVLEEICDHQGNCSQDAQSFKGIFFQHLTQFCAPLPLKAAFPGRTYAASRELAALHESSCLAIGAWIAHNAKAAINSRDREGRYGMWWREVQWSGMGDYTVPQTPGAEDYRNNATILLSKPWSWGRSALRDGLRGSSLRDVATRQLLGLDHDEPKSAEHSTSNDGAEMQDINDRGRGRTVETQTGGLAVLRAAWEMTSRIRYQDPDIISQKL